MKRRAAACVLGMCAVNVNSFCSLSALPKPHTAASTPERLSERRVALVLTVLMGLQPVTTDVYLPALPALARHFAAPVSQVQLTMSVLILAFGIAQLVWGPVADRVGRRPVLRWGLLLYVLASVGGALAGHIETLILWRALQGGGLAAAVVCSRAIVRDLYEPTQGARVMSLGMTGLGLIAICSPLMGGVAAAAGGWRAALALVAAVGVCSLAVIAWRLPETVPQRNPQATRLVPLLHQWAQIAVHPTFVAWGLLVALTYGGLFIILAGSSFIYISVLGLSPTAYGLALACGSVSYVLGTFLCRRAVARYGPVGAVARGAVFTLVAALLMLAVALTKAQSVAAVLLTQCVFAVGHGFHQPCGQAGVVGPFPRSAGAASALAGFVLALVAFCIGLGLGWVLNGTLTLYLISIASLCLATCVVAWTLVRRLPQ
jgi:MFS transporter, DHA1 family, multidrug resistance protein